MKFNYLLFIPLSIFIFTCCHHSESNELGHHHHHSDSHHEEEHEHGKSIVSLEPEDAIKFGVETDTVYLKEFCGTIQVSGEIVSPTGSTAIVTSKSAGIIHFKSGFQQGKQVTQGSAIAGISAKGITGGDGNEAIKTALDAAKRELDRITPLHNDGIVSTKEYNEVKSEYEKILATYSGNRSGSSATAPISGVVTDVYVSEGEYVEIGQQIAKIAKNARLSLRADLPEKYKAEIENIVSANIKISSSEDILSLSDLNGKLISSNDNYSNAGYIPVTFTFDNNGDFISGAFVEVYLLLKSGNRAISLPKDAIIEQQGTYFVYVQLDEDCYEKRVVVPGMSNGNDIEIRSGLSSGECVVHKGAIILKLAESSGEVPEGHTHNH